MRKAGFVARWVLDRGMDVNVRADVAADGSAGHTPLFRDAMRDALIALFLAAQGLLASCATSLAVKGSGPS